MLTLATHVLTIFFNNIYISKIIKFTLYQPDNNKEKNLNENTKIPLDIS
jgi:hypothetical protein